jgi:hypothetical protein
MKRPAGRYLPFSRFRRMMSDMLYFAKQVPSVPVQRVMRLAPLRDARAVAARKIAWPLLFTKAFALLARDVPALRQMHVSFPWECLYEHPHSQPSLSVETEYQGETIVFGLILKAPEETPLGELQDRLDRFRAGPIEANPNFRKSQLIARLPRFLRLALYWYLYRVAGPNRAKYLGTFGVTVYSALGAESLHPIATWTTTLNYGVFAADGSVPVRLVYDHRVMDGSTVARALGRLETILNGTIVQELSTLAPDAHSPVAA